MTHWAPPRAPPRLGKRRHHANVVRALLDAPVLRYGLDVLAPPPGRNNALRRSLQLRPATEGKGRRDRQLRGTCRSRERRESCRGVQALPDSDRAEAKARRVWWEGGHVSRRPFRSDSAALYTRAHQL